MTEIPEHLLQRSRERRAAMGGGDGGAGGGDGGGDANAASATPAKAAASTPAPSMPAHPAQEEKPAPAPPSPMVEAYNRRRKIPFWAMSVLAILPVWAYVYAGTLSPPPVGEGPVVLGEEAYAASGCAGCHGASGGGGVGPGFTGGAIYETFPTFEEHFRWVRLGSTGWQSEVGATYGANDKPVNGGMPGFGESLLSDADLLYIVLHERELGGANPHELDQERLELAAEIFFDHPEMTLEEVLAEVDAALGSSATDTGALPGETSGDDAREGGEDPAQAGQDDPPGPGPEAGSSSADAESVTDGGPNQGSSAGGG